MFIYIKYLILIIFSILLCLEDIRFKKVGLKTFIFFYLFTFILALTEMYLNYVNNNSFKFIKDSFIPIIFPTILCLSLFMICHKKIFPVGEGDILFIFILFFYFNRAEVLSITFSSLLITFFVSIIIISINLIINKKLSNKSIPFIPAFIPGILYFIGEKL